MESNAQLIRAEAELNDDVSWGGGLIAKLYRGGQFTYEQHEVSPERSGCLRSFLMTSRDENLFSA